MPYLPLRTLTIDCLNALPELAAPDVHEALPGTEANGPNPVLMSSEEFDDTLDAPSDNE